MLGVIKAFGTMFLLWLLMAAVGIMNEATMLISLVIFLLYRAGFFGFMVEWSLYMMEWWGDEGAELWDEAMKDRKKAKKKKAKQKAKAAAEKMGPPKGYISIEEHNDICRAMQEERDSVWFSRYNEGMEYGRTMRDNPSSPKEDAIFAYLFDQTAFEGHLKWFTQSSPNYEWWQYLGLHKNATTQEINAAFRQLAAKHHPDRNPGDEIALHAFQKISAAREIGIEKRKTRAGA